MSIKKLIASGNLNSTEASQLKLVWDAKTWVCL